MNKFLGTLFIVFVVLGLKAQDVVLPIDLRQHNLTEYNSSLLNPVFSLDRNNPSSIAFWARWQWQTYDADPTSLFLNYTTRLNEVSAAGVGFFQHNTGIFLNTGAVLNFAYTIALSEKTFLGIGMNLFGYQQELADQRFFVPNPIQNAISNDFVVQLAPGINLNVDRLNIGLTSENLFDYNFGTNEQNSAPDERMYLALASYDFPIAILNSDSNSVLRPSIYFKSIPGLDSQFGITSLLTTNKFWAQAGYNNFYGFSGGIGGHFFKRLSLGALVELGTTPELKGKDPSFEVVTSYKLGRFESPSEKLKEERIAEQEKPILKQVATKRTDIAADKSKRELRKERDSIEKAKADQALAAVKALEQQRKQDSIVTTLKAKEEALALAQKKKQDSIAQKEAVLAEAEKKREELALRNEVVKPQAGEKYEEVSKQGTLSPGYYLIANVFGTKKYYEAFMAEMKKKGLNPKSFFREANKYNYVYLGRYNSIKEARTARDSKLDGKYIGKLWIFRVTGE